MSKTKIGVKYCGHCNPLVDGPEIIRGLMSLHEHLEMVSWRDPDKQLLLIVSGCPVDCVEKPEFAGPIVQIAGASVNGRACSVQELPRAILAEIQSRLPRTAV